MKKNFFILSIILYVTIFGVNLSGEKKIIFKEIERVRLQLDNIAFASITAIKKIQDGFILIINESAYGDDYALLRLSKEGTVITKYKQSGSGPGDLGRIEALEDTGKTILVSESVYPYVHEFTYDLKFLRDYRIKRGGKIMLIGNYAAIWTTYTPGQKSTDPIYMVALYDSKNFEFKKYAFEISEIPALVHYWGNICKVDDNTYAGIYGTEYQIRLYDNEMNFKKNIIKNVPDYIKKYTSYKQSPRIANTDAKKWFESWTKVSDLFYAEGKFVLRYLNVKDSYLDIFDINGNYLIKKFETIKGDSITFTEGNYFWKTLWLDEETEKYWLIKTKLIIK